MGRLFRVSPAVLTVGSFTRMACTGAGCLVPLLLFTLVVLTWSMKQGMWILMVWYSTTQSTMPTKS